MQETTSRQLYDYWNAKRRGRMAPARFEIEPAQIAPLLPQTFIIECIGATGLRFRLAGTRVCEYFGRELRGEDLLDLWTGRDRDAVLAHADAPARNGAAGVLLFDGMTGDRRSVRFEMVLLPLVHSGNVVNRLLGSVCALTTPYWLGTIPLLDQVLVSIDTLWPDGRPTAGPIAGSAGLGPALHRLRVLQGGRDGPRGE